MERIASEVSKWRMLEPGDSVLLAISGGKDSFVLLDTLPRVISESKIVALTIIEGIPGYNRESDVEAIREHAKSLGVELLKISLKEYIGLDLSEIVNESRSRGLSISPCTYCGVARRHVMVRVANEIGARKIATAHVLDDEVQTLLMNIMRGDWRGVLKLHPASWSRSGELARIKPLRRVYEWEATIYAFFRGYRFQEVECPYISQHPTLRARIRARLLSVEKSNPGSLLKILDFIDDLLKHEASNALPEKLGVCHRCGSPTSPGRDYCRLCELLDELSVIGAYTDRAKRILGLERLRVIRD